MSEYKRKPREGKQILLPDLTEGSRFVIPKTLNAARDIDGITHVPGKGGDNPEIMFVSQSVSWEDVDRETSPPSIMKGPAGNLMNRLCLKVGIDIREEWCTSLVPIALPARMKGKPNKGLINAYYHLLENQIKQKRPKVIVCFSNTVFEAVTGLSMKVGDIAGGWFQYKDDPSIRVYYMDGPEIALRKPEMLDKFLVDLGEIKRFMQHMSSDSADSDGDVDYREIRTAEELINDMARISTECPKDLVLGIDMEGKGNFKDGLLRTIQYSHKIRTGSCVVLHDKDGNYVFDVPIEVVAKIISPVFNRECTRFVGHNIATDMPWFKHWVGVDMYRRIRCDTLFAQHLIDEYGDLKLERVVMQYTSMGRYDTDLRVWIQKTGHDPDKHGYFGVPDDILVPYSIKDVDAVLRIYPKQEEIIKETGQWEYWNSIRKPFTTDCFAEMHEVGLPCNEDVVDEQRDIFVFTRNMMSEVFLMELRKELREIFCASLVEELEKTGNGDKSMDLLRRFHSMTDPSESEVSDMLNEVKQYLSSPQSIKKMVTCANLYFNYKDFNFGSSADMIKLLYDVKEYEPITSTKGTTGYATAWEKVLKLDPSQQREYTPSTDKNTLKIFAERGDHLCGILTELRAVDTLTKNYLREDGNGIHKNISSDGFVRSYFGLTETGRPRSWKPNIFNSPGYVHRTIERAVSKVVAFCRENLGQNAEVFIKEYESKYGAGSFLYPHDDPRFADKIAHTRPFSLLQEFKSIRFNYQSKPGYCYVESDYSTAEVVAVAYLSCDEGMIKVVTEPDLQFALWKDPESGKTVPRRIQFIESNTTIDNPDAYRELLTDPNDPNLLRKEDGSLVHPRRDVHWEFVEHRNFQNKPRELLDKTTDRDGGGKVGNFCIAEGELVITHLGEVPIELVTKAHKVWDGIGYVEHDGVVFNGVKDVMYYQGLRATEGHVVYDVLGKAWRLGEAANLGIKIQRQGSRQKVKSPTRGEIIKAKTYDILNAGPRRRFMCSGVLVSNSVPYGGQAEMLERKYEVDTGRKPPVGTGDKIIKTYMDRYPIASEYLSDRELDAEIRGEFRSITGAVRRYHTHKYGDVEGLTDRARDAILSPLKREARNAPIQGLVADTLARAVINLTHYFKTQGMKARVVCPLYDACYTYAPLEERFAVAEAHQRFMCDENTWDIKGNTLKFEIETDFTLAWSTEPEGEDKKRLNDENYKNKLLVK